ncbi:MAG TPA: ABC transporter substrate-binding protein [Stellaceae bacterium]|nr:ABC transporter substrate-binding protein [Stellaceae bacterium]
MAYRLRLFENYRFVLYAPFYAAHALGAYDAEGLTVELLPSPGPGQAEAALAAGEVEVLWMGPIRVMKHHDDNPDSPLVEFAEIVCRDPFSLVGRHANPGFRLAELAGLRFASTSEVPTPWLCLEQDLRDAGIDPAQLDRVIGRGMPQNIAALADGSLDVAQLFEPYVEQAVSQGASVWQPASGRGRTSYTVFVTTRARLAADPEPFRRMTRAIYRAQRWVAAATPQALAELIASYFPALDRGVLARALARYQAQGVWAGDPVLAEDGFERLRRALLGSGFLKRAVPFAECVDNRLAAAAMADRAD